MFRVELPENSFPIWTWSKPKKESEKVNSLCDKINLLSDEIKNWKSLNQKLMIENSTLRDKITKSIQILREK